MQCIYGLNSYLKCSFKSIFEKKHRTFSWRYMKRLPECLYLKKLSLPLKISSCTPESLEILLNLTEFNENIENALASA